MRCLIFLGLASVILVACSQPIPTFHPAAAPTDKPEPTATGVLQPPAAAAPTAIPPTYPNCHGRTREEDSGRSESPDTWSTL